MCSFGLVIPNIVRPCQDYFPSIQKQMKCDSCFSKRILFLREPKAWRGVKTNIGNALQKHRGAVVWTRRVTSLMFTGEIHELFQGERGRERDEASVFLYWSMVQQPPSFSVCFSKWKDSELPEAMRRYRVSARECVFKRGKRSHKCKEDVNKNCAPCRAKLGLALVKKMNDWRFNIQNSFGFFSTFLSKWHATEATSLCVCVFLCVTDSLHILSCKERGATSLEFMSISGSLENSHKWVGATLTTAQIIIFLSVSVWNICTIPSK